MPENITNIAKHSDPKNLAEVITADPALSESDKAELLVALKE